MRLAVQLFTLREPMATDLGGTLGEVSKMGYRSVETAGLNGLSGEEFRSELDRAGLRSIASHVGLSEVEDALESTVQTAKALGSEWLVVPWVPQESYASGWGVFGARLSRISEAVLSHGLKFAYHNHAFEFELEDGVPGYENLWNGAEETVEAEIDLYWAHFAGQDPSEWLRRLAGRVPLAHFKDGAGGKFTPIGEGEMDWNSILPAATTAGVEWAIVELDESPRDPLECVATSFEYLRKLGIEA